MFLAIVGIARAVQTLPGALTRDQAVDVTVDGNDDFKSFLNKEKHIKYAQCFLTL